MTLDAAWLHWHRQLKLALRLRLTAPKDGRQWARACIAELRQINRGWWWAY